MGVSSGSIDAYVRSVFRPYRDASFALTDIYVSTSGSDSNNDGSIGSPFATIAKAVSIIPISVDFQVVIHLASAGLNFPTRMPFYNNITIRGEETVADTRTISSVSSVSNDNGIVFTVGGAALTANQWKGQHLHVTTALTGTRNIISVYNDTSNVISGPMYTRASPSDAQGNPSGGSVDLITYTQAALTAATIVIGSTNFNIEMVNITGNFSFFALATDKVNIWKCKTEVKNFIAGRSGGLYLLSCTIANFGDGTNGVLAFRNGGDLRLGFGTVVTDINSGANLNFISGQAAAIFTTEGGVVFSNLDARGIELDNCNMFSISQANLKIIFEEYSGSSSNAAGFIINSLNGVGLNYSISEAHGGVLSDYYVKAKGNANVKIASSTSVTTATVTNAVSADGGTTAVALVADGTRIEGGVPLLSGVLIPQEEYAVKYNASAANNIGFLGVGLTGGGYPSLLNIGYRKDLPPFVGNSGTLGIPFGVSNLNGNILVTETNSIPGTAVPIYFEAFMGEGQDGAGYQFGKFYADLNSVSPGMKYKQFTDQYDRQWIVYNISSPSTDDRLSPVYVDPTAVGVDDRDILSIGNQARSDIYFMSQGGGYIRSTGEDATFALNIDVSAVDPAACLYYDDAGSGVDVNIVAGLQNGPSQGEGINTTPYVVTTPIYFVEGATNDGLRLYHRLAFAPYTLRVPISGTNGLVLEVQYDGSGVLGEKVYYKTASFPADFESVNPSLGDSTFKTSPYVKSYQSNTD